MKARMDRFLRRLEELDLTGALVTSPVNVGYLSGFTGSTALLVVTPKHRLFVTDSRYAVQARAECPDFDVVQVPPKTSYDECLAAELSRRGIDRLAVEAAHVSLQRYQELQAKLKGVELRPSKDLVDPLRRVKDAGELAAIREACALVDAGFAHVLPLLRPGTPEIEVAAALEYFLKRRGSDALPFDIIVASGARSALPHGRASGKLLERGDFVTLDFGARIAGYVSDLTRTVVLGPATSRQREVYDTVLEAQQAALRVIAPGSAGADVDAVARDLIAARGFGEHFGHGLGHGIGRTVHDHAAMSATSKETLEAGWVVTLEPGIYIEGWGGVRVEDDVLVTETGGELLTRSPRELLELDV